MLVLKRLARVPAAERLPLEQARRELLRQQLLVGGKQRVGAVVDLEVDGAEGPMAARMYVPTERLGSGPVPTMLYLHGGGWMYGDLESHDPVCRFLAERSGVQLLAIDYRLAPEHPFPAAVEDCRAAYRWLVDHADDLDADPERLAVGGDSAGGALAHSTAVWAAEKGLPLAFQLLIYPGADFVDRAESRRTFGEGYVLTEQFMTQAEEAYLGPLDADRAQPPADRAQSRSDRAQPPADRAQPPADRAQSRSNRADPDASAVRRTEFPAGLAPAHVVTAGYDPLRDEGEALARLLAEHGVEVDHVRYPSMIHGFMHIVGTGHETRAYSTEIADRLRRALAAD